MLISKNAPKDGDVVTVRLVSGDEVVGTLMTSGSSDIVLSNPIAAVMQPTRSGEIALAFAPFIASIEEEAEVAFPASAILCRPAKTRADVAKGYTEATKPKSSIITPNKGLLLP